MLLESGKVNVLTLIGSSKVADHLKKMHPKVNRLRAILGLDAKNAAIVLPDADIELAVKECLLGSLSFNGQRCTALKMLIVHRSIVDRFLQRFTEELAKLKVGMPWDKGVSITPLPGTGQGRVHDPAASRTPRRRAPASSTRAAARTGGTLFYPAVVYPVREGMMLYREEQFGPIVPVMPFEDLETALEYVITSEHGQQVIDLQRRPGPDRQAGRSAGQSGLPRQHQLPVPARAGRLPLHGPEGLGRGHLVGHGCAALVLDPLDDRGQADRGQQAAARRHRERAQIELHQHAVYLLTAASIRDQGEARGP